MEGNKRKGQIIILAVAVAAAMAIGAAWERRPEEKRPAQEAESVSAQPAEKRPVPSVRPSGEPVDNRIWQDGLLNILLIGTDELYSEADKGRGDAALLCSLNRKAGTVKLVSFERSIGVPWPEHGDIMLTNTYSYGGAALMCQDISRCFQVDIDGYVQLDFEGFCAMVDALGGIDLLLSAQEAQALTEDLYYEQTFTEGKNHLDGQAALRYCRLRRIDDNWKRVERQRYLITAVLQQAKQMRLGEIKDMAKLAAEYVDTDFSKAELAALALSAPRFVQAEPQQLTVPDRNRIWTYNSGEETVTGCDFGAESRRLREFLYGSETVQTSAIDSTALQ